MTTGGLFNLIANDGKADRMLHAYDMLKSRIQSIRKEKKQRDYDNTDPTLSEIEQTHNLFVSAHYKPFVASAYEYLSEDNNSGRAEWGGDVKYQIPVAGDFFNDMVLNLQTNTLKAKSGEVPSYPDLPDSPDNTVWSSVASDTNYVIYNEDTTNNFLLFRYRYVDSQGNKLEPGASIAPYVRWNEWPGIHALRKVEFEVSSNILDDYTSDVMLMYYRFNVSPDKETGFKKIMGEQIAREAVTDYVSNQNSTQYFDFSSNLTSGGSASEGTPQDAGQTTQIKTQIYNGNQTPDVSKSGLNLWIPLIFWFCEDVKIAIPSVAIPYGQRYINVEFEEFDRMASSAPGNLYLEFLARSYTTDGTTSGDPDDPIVGDTSQTIRYQSVMPKNGGVDENSGGIKRARLWINHIYLMPEIHDLFIKRIGFNLIRIHKVHTDNLNSSASSDDGIQSKLTGLKFPIETMYIGFRPTQNQQVSNSNYWRNWHRFVDVTERNADEVATVPFLYDTDASQDGSNGLTKAQSQRYTYYDEDRVVNQIGLESHGVTIYKNLGDKFWNAYFPFRYGGDSIQTPEQDGVYMISFAFYPGSYAPTGHLNLSRAKDTMLKVVSDYINSTNEVKLIVVGIAINFLLVSDGNAVLRYQT